MVLQYIVTSLRLSECYDISRLALATVRVSWLNHFRLDVGTNSDNQIHWSDKNLHRLKSSSGECTVIRWEQKNLRKPRGE